MDNMNRLSRTPTFSASALAASTADAYAFSAYGAKQWFACALLLAGLGYNLPEATAILYSKIMRLAADARQGRRATSADVATFLAEPSTQTYLTENLDEYVLNILGEDLIATPAPAPRPLRLVWSR